MAQQRRPQLPLIVLLAPLLASCGAPPPPVTSAIVVVPASKPEQGAADVEARPRREAPAPPARTIPGTEIPDTPENVAAIAFCERYRRAVLDRDIDLLISMTSPDYYEDGGNVDASDDMDYQALVSYLRTQFSSAAPVRYEMRYLRVVRDDGVVFVDFAYDATYRVAASKSRGRSRTRTGWSWSRPATAS